MRFGRFGDGFQKYVFFADPPPPVDEKYYSNSNKSMTLLKKIRNCDQLEGKYGSLRFGQLPKHEGKETVLWETASCVFSQSLNSLVMGYDHRDLLLTRDSICKIFLRVFRDSIQPQRMAKMTIRLGLFRTHDGVS